jgi:hypothetical protein
MSIEAMKQALEFIDSVKVHPTQIATRDALHTALCAAIEEAEKQDYIKLEAAYLSGLTDGKEIVERQWIGLTVEEKRYLNEVLNLQGRFPIIDAIEAKLKEKNT